MTSQPRLYLALSLIAAPAAAVPTAVQAQIVRGQVIEAAARIAVRGATLELRDERGRAVGRVVSDSLGLFSLTVLNAGTYTLQTTHPSYFAHPADTLRLGPAESVTIEVRLDPAVIPLQPLIVTTRARGWLEGFETRRRTGGFGRFLTRQDIDARQASRSTDLLRGVPGVILTQQRRGPPLLQMRGTGGLCMPAIWIDGLHIPHYAGGTTIDDALSPLTLDGVEIYNSVSSAPIEYRTGSCGVVLFWTRRGSGEEGGTLQWKKVLAGLGAAAFFVLMV
jgi:hypothetical protein